MFYLSAFGGEKFRDLEPVAIGDAPFRTEQAQGRRKLSRNRWSRIAAGTYWPL